MKEDTIGQLDPDTGKHTTKWGILSTVFVCTVSMNISTPYVVSIKGTKYKYFNIIPGPPYQPSELAAETEPLQV